MTEHSAPSTVFLAVHSDGRRVPVTIQIPQPQLVGPDEWECAARLAGLHDDLAPARGGDALQALLLAAALVRELLTSFVSAGGRLLFLTGEEVPLSAYFGPWDPGLTEPPR